MNFQDDITSIDFDSFKDNHVLVFKMTSTHDAAEICLYPELIGEPLILELFFTYRSQHVTEILILRERISSVAADKFGVVGMNKQRG